MLVMLRFPPDTIDLQRVEVAVQACIGGVGSVVGASESSVDFHLTDSVPAILAQLAGILRNMDMPADTYFDIPASGQRFGLSDF